MSIKATHQEAIIHFDQTFVSIIHIIRPRFVGSNISRHISILLLIFCWIFENNWPGGGVLAQLFCPGSGFPTFFVPGRWGIHPFKKIPQEFARGEMVRLGIDCYSKPVSCSIICLARWNPPRLLFNLKCCSDTSSQLCFKNLLYD